jgi:D-beta-D-heptose 7-phosphate kinase/D-beta-D-heptose 1-phosphate adenosyltransferase
VLTRSRVEQILSAFSGKNIVVLGDVMLDEFLWGKARRISPEAPVPVVEIVREEYRLGGAANVVANIRALGGTALPVGVVGNDHGAERVIELMQQLGIDTSSVVRDGRPTTLKTRILAHKQQIVRADREQRAALCSETNRVVADVFINRLKNAHAVVVSDYDKGVVNRELMAEVLPRARDMKVPVFLDPKVHHADYYKPITMITPNQAEAELLTGIQINDTTSLEEAGRRLRAQLQCEYALITRGEEGMSLFNEKSSHHLPTFAREVFDVTGAGDTVIATLALARAGGASMEEAAILANHAAGIVVGKVGTSTVNQAELLADFDGRNAHSAG